VLTHPINLDRDPYDGANEDKKNQAEKYNKIAEEIELSLNEIIEKEGSGRYLYSILSKQTHFSIDTLRDYLLPIGGGYFGFTVEI